MRYILSLVLTILFLQTFANAQSNYSADSFYTQTVALFEFKEHKEKDKALKFLTKQLKSDPRANYYLGLLFHHGLGFKQNIHDALTAYESSIKLYHEQNNTEDIVLPLHNAGILLTADKEKKEKYEKGMKYLLAASDFSYHRATYALIGRLGRDPGDLANLTVRKKMIVLYKRLLTDKKYRAKALLGLGSMYAAPVHGGSLIDYDKARKYWLEAAETYKEKVAYIFLADLYDRNGTTFQNKKISGYWCMKYYTDDLSVEFSGYPPSKP